jgi:hypothetical protein
MITIDNTKRYGIMLSGGLDSAVLFYLLLKENPNINLQPFTIPKFDGAALYAGPIVDYYNRMFSINIAQPILVGDPDAYHRQQSKIAITDIFNKTPVDILFVAINQNPPALNMLPGAPQRDTKSNNPKILFPFVDMHKDQILQIMYNEGQEHLINITHSCTEQQIGRCGQCWQCTERAWAFSQLNKIDTGTA